MINIKKIFLEYSNILGMTFTGLVFGFTFFLFFINLYHYKELKSVYKREKDDVEVYQSIQENINTINYNVKKYNINSYVGSVDKTSLLLLESKLSVCVDNLNNKKITNILDKNELTVKDIYNLEKYYKEYVVNNCLAKQLYSFSTSNELNIDSFKVIKPFLTNQINTLMDYTDYAELIIESNSNYFIVSASSKESIGDLEKESFYKILNAYRLSTDYVLEISNWYNNIIGGTN